MDKGISQHWMATQQYTQVDLLGACQNVAVWIHRKITGALVGYEPISDHHLFFKNSCQTQLCTKFIDRYRYNKKLSYRRGTARCVVSVEILQTATQQCRTTSPDQIDGMKLKV